MTHPTPDTPAVPPSEAEALARVMHDTFIRERDLDGWLGIARAVLASDWLAKVKADARAEGAREVTERVEAVLAIFEQSAEASPHHAYAGPWLAMVDDVRAALAPTAEAGR